MNPGFSSALVASLISGLIIMINTAVSGNMTGWRNRNAALRSLAKGAAQNYTLAMQDRSPLMRLIHITVSGSYIAAIREVASDALVGGTCGVDIGELRYAVNEEQDRVIAALNDKYPSSIQVHPSELRAAGWLI